MLAHLVVDLGGLHGVDFQGKKQGWCVADVDGWQKLSDDEWIESSVV